VSGDALEVLDEIFFSGGGSDFAAAAAFLGAVEGEWGALDIAAVRDGDELILLDDQIFY
jgi:hypothetical protein